jgi:hypothetical protein
VGAICRLLRSLRRRLAAPAARQDPLLRAELLRSLGSAYLLRYQYADDPTAAVRAVQHRSRALNLLAVVDSDALAIGEAEADLAQALLVHYEIDDRPEQLDRAVALLETARRRTPEQALHDTADRTLAICLETRSHRTSSIADARRAEQLHRALRDRHTGDPVERALLTANFANALATVYELGGGRAAATAAGTEARAAAQAIPRTDPRAAAIWSAASDIQQLLLGHDSDPALIEEAVQAARLAVRLAHDGDVGLDGYLVNLVNALLLEHDMTGNPDPVNEAVRHARRAVRGTPPGWYGRAAARSALASALRARYDVDGDRATLREALRYDRSAVAETLPGDAARTSYLNNLAIALFTLHEHEPDPQLLAEAEQAAEDAIAAGADGADGADRHLLLQTLARVLFIRHQHTSAIPPLRRAADLDRRALGLLDPADAGWTETAGNLAADLIALHQAATDSAALHEATDLLERAVNDLRREGASADAPDRPDLARNLYNLGVAHAELAKAGQELSTEHRTAAIAALRAAAALASAPATLRAEAAMEWGKVAAATGDWAAAADGFAQAIELLPLVSPRRLNRRDQERRIGIFDGLARDAAAAVLAGNPHDAARAVELLDRGRGVLLAQLLTETDDLARARAAAPALAGQFERLRDALDADSSHPSTGGTRRPRERLTADLADTIAAIRAVPGLADFLVTPAIGTLQAAAAAGPVVLLNVSEYRCDALLLTTDAVRSVPLPQVTPARVAEAVRMYHAHLRRPGPAADARLRAVFRWLWTAVAEPVLDALGAAARDHDWPRLWWCPTGPLALLPIHAAARWDAINGEDIGVLDRVVSSYTATVRALTAVRNRPAAEPGTPLVVALPDGTPDAPDLPHVAREVDAIRRSCPQSPQTLLGPAAHLAAVREALGRHAWLHFAGHSSHDLDDPGRGRLRLSDGDLTATEIAALRLNGAQFAYVSSCDGATTGATVLDEPLHLALALQLAGFRHVIAASRPIDDRRAADLAASVYDTLAATGRLDPAAAAQALHLAVRRLRHTHPPATWAPYLHAGP